MRQVVRNVIKSKYFIGTLIVTLIYGIMLLIGKVTPFGQNTILIGDLNAQYVKLFCYLKEILAGNKGLFLSWNLGMANGFYTNFLYYLINPLNILVIFFNKSQMYILIELIIYLKFVLIFNCFTIYIEKVYNYKKINSILFGIAYTFSSYVIVYFFNIMWIDVLYVLPISILFINNYIKKGKLYPVVLTYLYMLFVQYYMAYSMIIFCSVYYVVLYLMQDNRKKIDIKDFLKKTVPLVIVTILSVGIAMIIFIPTLNLMTKITNMQEKTINFENIDLISIISNLTNHFEYKNTQNLGFAFCGSLITILLVYFFINRNIQLKEKIIYGYLLLFLFLPVISPKIYSLWHGGTITHGLNFRYSYLNIFVFVTIAFKTYSKTEREKKHFILLYIFFGIIALINLLLNMTRITIDKTYCLNVVISIIIIILNISFLFILSKYKKAKHIVFILLIVIEIVDISVVFYQNNRYTITKEKYNENEDAISKSVECIEIPELERMVVDEEEEINNSLRYNYSSFIFFASGRNVETVNNMNKIGYKTDYVSVVNDSKTLFTEMMSGVKYYVLKEGIDKKYNNNYNNLLKLVKKINDDYYLYRNDILFPFAYYIPKNLKILDDKNIFEAQNQIMNNYGKGTKEKFIYNIEEENNILTYKKNKRKKNTDNKYFNYTLEYNIKTYNDTDIYIKYNNKSVPIILEVDKNNHIFTLGDAKMGVFDSRYQEIYKNFYSNYTILHLVSLKKGESALIEIDINDKDFKEENLEIVAFDDLKIKNKVNSVKQDILEIKNIGKNGMNGNIRLNEDGYVCFEIAYDQGWHVEIDGKETETEAIYGVFLGAQLEKGEHDIKIYYIPKGFKEGVIISLISAIMLCIFLIIYEKSNRADCR